MTAQILQARQVDIRDLIDNFGLQLVEDLNFFQEWQTELPDISDADKQFLDKVKAGYINLVNYPPLPGKAIQVAVLGPLLFLADFFLPPFHIKAEHSIALETEDDGVIVRGQLDILLLKENFWALVIESKKATYSFEAGLAQLLTYMLADPNTEKPGFGLIAAGGGFVFVKLVRASVPTYGISRIFETRNPGNDLYDVLRILKRIGQL